MKEPIVNYNKINKYMKKIIKELKYKIGKGGYRYVLSTPLRYGKTINHIINLHRKILQVPIKIDDVENQIVIILAHRKTHKRIKLFVQQWKPSEAVVKLKHASWDELKG